MNAILLLFATATLLPAYKNQEVEKVFNAKIAWHVVGPGELRPWSQSKIHRLLYHASFPSEGMISETGELIGAPQGRFALYHSKTLRMITKGDLLRFRAPKGDPKKIYIHSVSQETYIPGTEKDPLLFANLHVIWSERKILAFQNPGGSLLFGYLEGSKNLLFAGLVDLKERGPSPNKAKAFPLAGAEPIQQISVDRYSNTEVILQIVRSRDLPLKSRIEAYRLDLTRWRLSRIERSALRRPDLQLPPGRFSGATYLWKAAENESQSVREGEEEKSTAPYFLSAVSKNRRFALVINKSSGEAWILKAKRGT